jgi:membrane associated rhomboid family serine protease
MLAFSVWMVLLTAALLLYPRRPRTAGGLIAAMGVWTYLLRYLPWNNQRVNTGYWTAWYTAAFWLAWGVIWIVRYSNAERRSAHLAYWTEKKT